MIAAMVVLAAILGGLIGAYIVASACEHWREDAEQTEVFRERLAVVEAENATMRHHCRMAGVPWDDGRPTR
ncbi:MAG TPA: hypothetical protein VFJ14_06845 [Nocardioidaceae bacterium]|nr:hypothetical protein [Nocardioidaceae bacterium]